MRPKYKDVVCECFFVCFFQKKIGPVVHTNSEKKGFACQIQFRKQDFCGLLLSTHIHTRVTSLEQMSIAEFSGE